MKHQLFKWGICVLALFSVVNNGNAQTKKAKKVTKPALTAAKVASGKPNIVIIWGDDVGMWNLSCYHRGMMGGSTPNIDRIAKEGIMFMDHYAQSSCTAGRASFITGQYPMRTGLSTVGLPGAPQGLQKEDPTIAEMLKPLGYATGQFGKNHLGDLDKYLPTAHGFDEFYGILYHLNAGEYPEQYDYPKDSATVKKFGFDKARGITHSWANADGTQKIEDLGPFGMEVQRHLDQDVLRESKRFIKDAAAAGKPFFVWHNTTRMHYRTNLSTTYAGKSGYGLYADGMMELDDIVGGIMKQLDESGVADNTVIMFATDNGAASNSWPDGGNQPFHGEKGAGGWEGGFRVPVVVKYPGKIPAGTVTGEFMTMEDWLPTLLSWAGQPNVKQELLTGKTAGKMTYKVHLDGYDQSDMIFNGGKSKRKDFYYFTETTFHGFRYGDWKFLYKKQDKWFNATQEELTTPYIINLKLDPFEKFIDGGGRGYDEWEENHAWLFGPALMQVSEYVQSFKDFPPRQPSFSPKVDDIISTIGKSPGIKKD